MRRARLYLVAFGAVIFGGVIGRAVEDQSRKARPPTWLLRIDVAKSHPSNFKLKLGDWIEIFARPEGQEIEVQTTTRGDALERFADVRTASVHVLTGTAGDRTSVRADDDRDVPTVPHAFLRAVKIGKVAIETVVIHDDTWKEIRRLEIEVTREREDMKSLPKNYLYHMEPRPRVPPDPGPRVPSNPAGPE